MTGRDIPLTGRVVGVDLGDVRMGIAVSDPEQTVATPVETVTVGDADDREAIADAIGAAAERAGAVGVVIGLPRTLDGRDGAAAHRARDIASRVAPGLGVALWDERFTTTEAERVMIEQGTRRRARRQAIDRVAATIILQGWLDRRRHGGR